MVNDGCVAGCCDINKIYPDRMIVHGNVASRKLIFHKTLVHEESRKA